MFVLSVTSICEMTNMEASTSRFDCTSFSSKRLTFTILFQLMTAPTLKYYFSEKVFFCQPISGMTVHFCFLLFFENKQKYDQSKSTKFFTQKKIRFCGKNIREYLERGWTQRVGCPFNRWRCTTQLPAKVKTGGMYKNMWKSCSIENSTDFGRDENIRKKGRRQRRRSTSEVHRRPVEKLSLVNFDQ